MGQVLRKAAFNIFRGQSIMNISLPVSIFEPRSLLERICDWFGYAPKYLKEAALFHSPQERFKNVIAYGISSLHISVKPQKPFNPILGETYQGFYEDGTRLFCE